MEDIAKETLKAPTRKELWTSKGRSKDWATVTVGDMAVRGGWD